LKEKPLIWHIIKLQMISFSCMTIRVFQLLHLALRELSISFEIVQYLYLNDIIEREATDVFLSITIFVISHQFRCTAQVKITLMPAEIKLLSHVCQENA